MLLKRSSPGKQQPPKEIVKGIFMPKEQRIETRNEICRAHFNLGSEEVSKYHSLVNCVEFPEKSFSHYHYSNGEVQQNKSEQNKKIA
jgi:hypothetical protein